MDYVTMEYVTVVMQSMSWGTETATAHTRLAVYTQKLKYQMHRLTGAFHLAREANHLLSRHTRMAQPQHHCAKLK